MVGSCGIPGRGLRLRRVLRLEGWTPDGAFHGADTVAVSYLNNASERILIYNAAVHATPADNLIEEDIEGAHGR